MRDLSAPTMCRQCGHEVLLHAEQRHIAAAALEGSRHEVQQRVAVRVCRWSLFAPRYRGDAPPVRGFVCDYVLAEQRLEVVDAHAPARAG